jgi:hypothetical protein
MIRRFAGDSPKALPKVAKAALEGSESCCTVKD